MTIITGQAATMNARTWTIAQAKARLSEVIERARREGPQTITRHGKQAVVIVDAAEWGRREPPREGSLASFFLESPLGASGVEAVRLKDGPRGTEL